MCFQVFENNALERDGQGAIAFFPTDPEAQAWPVTEAASLDPLTQLAANLGQGVALNVPARAPDAAVISGRGVDGGVCVGG